MSLIDSVWSSICKCYPTVSAYNECVISGFTNGCGKDATL